MRAVVLFAAVLAVVPAAAQQMPERVAEQEVVIVTGSSRQMLAPDRVTFTLGVETVAPTVQDAVRENNRKVASVIAALRKAGVAEEQIRTTSFNIFPQHESEEGRRRPRVVGYQVSNMVTVTQPASADVGAIIQAAIDAGANQAFGINFIVAESGRGRERGLREAVDDARVKAKTLAEAAGRKLGRVISLSEGTMPPPRIERGERAMAMEAVSVPIQPGQQDVTFTVTVIFELH